MAPLAFHCGRFGGECKRNLDERFVVTGGLFYGHAGSPAGEVGVTPGGRKRTDAGRPALGRPGIEAYRAKVLVRTAGEARTPSPARPAILRGGWRLGLAGGRRPEGGEPLHGRGGKVSSSPEPCLAIAGCGRLVPRRRPKVRKGPSGGTRKPAPSHPSCASTKLAASTYNLYGSICQAYSPKGGDGF